MTYDSLVNRGDYFSAHYLAEVFPKDLKSGLLAAWKTREEEAKSSDSVDQEPDPDALPVTPRLGLRALRRPYFRTRAFFAEAAVTHDDDTTYDAPEWRERAASLNSSVLRALGYDAKPRTLTASRADHTYEIPLAHAEPGLVAVDCGWAAEPDAALDPDGPGRLLTPVQLDASTSLRTGSKLASFLFASEDAPRYVLLLAGGVIVLADRAAWGEGRYLAASLDTALDRNNTKDGQELDTLAALFGADSLRTPEEGGENPLAGLVDKSTKHAVGVSSELRDGLRESVELIANEVLARITSHDGVRLEDVKELPELSRQLTRESLRYLYRILFLLYAEARPELGILPSDYPEYHQGYGLGRLGELVAERDLVGEKARKGVYLYESLDLLFSKVQEGYRPRRTHGVGAKDSEDVGLRFEPLHSKLFEPESIRLIGAESVKDPRHDDDSDEGPRYLDTRLRNATLYKVLRKLMLTRGRKGERGGFISYAQLGINQLGAVYEGLMSYAGFIAGEELYEVAKNGDPKDGSWLIPSSKADEYADSVFVRRRDEETGADVRVRYLRDSFVYRLSGRDRQTSASYYTPESLTKVTVQLALQHRLDQDDTVTEARELLDWKICEPALGSGAFLNEAINQVASEYLRRRQEETGQAIDTEQYPVELQKAKAYIALHNSYGVDLNSTAVELAEVSLWLNTMHPGMEAPWFGLHLRRGNSLIGGRREIYGPDRLKKGGWLGATPERFPLTEASSGLPSGSVHHFLLPAKEWGAVAAEKEAKALAPEEAKALGAWRKAITKSPSAKQTARLQGLARRAEYLWQLVVRRLEISERDISRKIDVWGAEPEWLRQPVEAVQREEVLADLEAVDTPYWRLKTLMDAWCALWFWPVQEASLLDGTNPRYRQAAELAEQSAAYEVAVSGAEDEEDEDESAGVLMSWEEEALPGFGTEAKQLSLTQEAVAKRRMGRRKESITERRREVIPLANLDDWLDFAESLLGTQDVPAESLIAEFESLTELTPYEDALPDLMGMDRSYWLESRFPWAAKSKDIASQQGFFHWELEYAQVFEQGGYDLQVGNPPWVRPRWQEDVILAEQEPWFALAEKPSATEWRLRKGEVLREQSPRSYLHELAANVGTVATLSSITLYPLVAGTQPDLYRTFMCRTWAANKPVGVIGLIHPDSHFAGTKEGALRAAAYRHLRVHAHFQNRRLLFTEVDWNKQFGIHIYGSAREANFLHASWLFDPEPLVGSFRHDGSGDLPGIKHEGTWDLRPHRARLVKVDTQVLRQWQQLSGEIEVPVEQTKLLYPVSSAEQSAISALAATPVRLAHLNPSITRGFDEKGAKDAGLIRWDTSDPGEWGEVVLRGPQIGVGTPMAKQPPHTSHVDKAISLVGLSDTAVPTTDYRRACSRDEFDKAHDKWGGRPYTDYFRATWREMVPASTERSLFVSLIPPGPSHIHGVRSMACTDNRTTALTVGFWSSLPLDYLVRIGGRGHLDVTDARSMPAPNGDHPLADALLLRTLRLNCLTEAYAPIWADLYRMTWPGYEGWANAWPQIRPLSGHLGGEWSTNSPLRTEFERRAALAEIDALVAVWLGISGDELVALYLSRFPQLVDYESEMWFDTEGRRISASFNAYGSGQSKETYLTLLDHLDSPATTPPPEGYTAPFYKADRETEMRAAHAHFSARLDAEIAAGRWTPPVKADA
ncbi:class I SAM-dependent DNA methyltransferase [Streptomyces sp. NPDC087228]|uniref:class I SAM-dependent DNA methyltransferase n=1 Tax=Streptomyces sp. NPDC087228 TaxID=3365772 RepID=UPI0037FEB4DD